ncbi:MAG: amidase [Hyphomicrobiaceae bacterium]
MTEPCELSAVEARRLIGNKALSPVELLESCLRRIEATNPTLNSIVAMDAEVAREAARNAERAIMHGEPLGLLHGLPTGIKDLQATAGLTTTWGSLIHKDHVPDDDEDTVANLRDEGAVILAKTNTPEFGAGGNSRNSVYGATGNPFDPTKTCGGSSGGSAVALATCQVPVATGSDYGGSLRTPASFCGVFGFRPSPGLVPGVDRSSLVTPFPVNGPMGRSVEDLHLLLRAQLDIDKRDPYSSDDAMRIPETLTGIDLGSMSVAISDDLGCAPVDNDIRAIFKERMLTVAGSFGETAETSPDFGNVHDVFETMRGVYFAASHHARLENHRDILGPNVIDNTERGLKLTGREIALAHVEHGNIVRRFADFFGDFDVLICPAAGVSPFPHSEWYPETINGETMPTYMRWLAIKYAPTTALACSAVLPCGRDHLGMPFGIQVMGPNGSDALVLEVAHALEQVLAGNSQTQRAVPDLSAIGS